MSFSLETKLHILLIITVIGIALYMYLLYKEVKVFQDEIVLIKAQIYPLIQNVNSQKPLPQCSPDTSVVPEVLSKDNVYQVQDVEVDDDDDDSVTSNEIKNILTNMNVNDDDVDDIVNEDIVDDIDVGEVEDSVQKDTQDFSKMSLEELGLQKYESLKDYLKSNKKSTKGNKSDMIKRILE